MVPPPTPLFAGMPTVLIHEPASSYIPHVVITERTRSTARMSIASTPVSGLRPEFASVAAMTERSTQLTMTEHCRK